MRDIEFLNQEVRLFWFWHFDYMDPESHFFLFSYRYQSYSNCLIGIYYIKVKWSRYRPGVAQRVGKVIALLFHDRGTRRGWVFSSTPRPHFTAGKDPVPIVQEAGWAPGTVWAEEKSRPNRDSIPDRPVRSQSLYRLSYPALIQTHVRTHTRCEF